MLSEISVSNHLAFFSTPFFCWVSTIFRVHLFFFFCRFLDVIGVEVVECLHWFFLLDGVLLVCLVT